jgi:hypothetical protein
MKGKDCQQTETMFFDYPYVTEILLRVALNTITITVNDV